MGAIPNIEQSERSPELVQLQLTEGAAGRLKNYAEDDAFVTRMKRELLPLLGHIRDRRTGLEAKWDKYLRVWTLEHDEQQAYMGRSNIYMPAGKKGVETLVAQLVRGTFPGDDNFGVECRQGSKAGAQQATFVKATLQHRIESTANVRVHAERFYRQLCLTGNSPVKMYYDRRTRQVKRRELEGLGAPEMANETIYDGPVFESVDIRNFYVWPETVNDPKHADIVFEDLTVPLATLRSKAAQGIYVRAAVEAAAKRNPSHESVQNAKLAAQELTSVHDTQAGHYGSCDITEVWLDIDPAADSKSTESEPVPFLVTVAGSEVIRAIKNPWWHQRNPYSMGRMGTQVGRVYGTGYVESIRELNLLLNDQTNQGMDCGTFALNPIVIMNPNAVIGKLNDIEPGAQWLVNDINSAVKFDRPPLDLLQATSMLTTQSQAWINDYIGAPPVLQGGSSPGRAFRTATGIGTAQTNAQIPLQEVIRLCEAEVWEQMLYMFWALDQQFAEDAFLLNVGGTGMQRIDPKQLRGDWVFKWLASTQQSNQQVKGAQILQAIQLLSSPGVVQSLQASGTRVNVAPLARRFYQEVLGFRDVDDVLIAEAMAADPKSGLTPSVGGNGAPQDGPMNLPEGLADNPEFLAMREGADGIAAAMGGMPDTGGLTE